MKIAIFVVTVNDLKHGLPTEAIRDTWAKNLPDNVNVYYNYGLVSENPQLNEPPPGESVILDGDKIICGIHESFQNLTEKTIRSLDFFSKNLTEYDYVFKCCNGGYFHIENFLKFVSSKEKTNVYAGVRQILRPETENFPYISGAGVLFSKDVLKMIADNTSYILSTYGDEMDDIAIAKFLSEHNIPVDGSGSRTDIFNEDVLTLTCVQKDEYHYHTHQTAEGIRHIHTLFLNKKYC